MPSTDTVESKLTVAFATPSHVEKFQFTGTPFASRPFSKLGFIMMLVRVVDARARSPL